MGTRGFLMFCYNNDAIDYGTMALCNALLIKKKCRINDVTIVTDQRTMYDMECTHGRRLLDLAFDVILVRDGGSPTGDRRYFDTRYTSKVGGYINGNRLSAYDLSPYDETILIDSDYLILDDNTDIVWGIDEEFLCNRRTIDLDHRPDSLDVGSRIDDMGIHLYWATMVYFKKTVFPKLVFEMMSFIRDNYEFYKCLYNFETTSYFRNDFALSISLHVLNGFQEMDVVKPFPIDHITVSTDRDEMHDFSDGVALVTSEPEQGRFNLHRVSMNTHFMNKQTIVRNSEKMIRYATAS